MKQATKKQLVMIGIRRKGEKGFTIQDNPKKKAEKEMIDSLSWIQNQGFNAPLMPADFLYRA